MIQNEVRTTEHHHTPSSKAREPGRHKSNQIPGGRDQQKTLGQGPTRDQPQGGGKQKPAGKGSRQQPSKGQTQRNPTTHREAHNGHGKCTRNSTGRNTNTTNTPPNKKGATHERKRNKRPRTQDGRESTAPIKTAPKQLAKLKNGGPGGTEPHGGTQKDPHHTAASGSKSQRGAEGQRAQETKRQKRDNKTE